MRRADGKMDRRSLEYREAVARMARARRAMKAQRRAVSRGPRRRSDGGMDQRTAAGKAMARKMARMRAMRGRSKSFFSWLLGD